MGRPNPVSALALTMDTILIEISFWLVFFIIPAIPWVFLLYLALDKGPRSGFSDIYWKKGVYGAFPMFALSLITFYAHFTTPDSEVKNWYHGFCFIWSCGAGFLAGDLIAFGVLFKILGPAVFLDWIFYAVLVVFLVTFGFLVAALMQGHWARRYRTGPRIPSRSTPSRDSHPLCLTRADEDLFFQSFPEAVLLHFQFVMGLQVEPEAFRGSEIARQPKTRVRGDRAFAVNNLVDTARRHTDILGQAILADAVRV